MTETLEQAITIHQPYAWAVAAGHKPVENRTWRPPLEAVGKLIGIHAGRQQTQADPSDPMADWARAQPDYRLNLGALIGVARLVGVVKRLGKFYDRDDGGPSFGRCIGKGAVLELLSQADSKRIEPWWRGSWGWLLEEAVLLPEPIPMRGQQGLWRIPTEPAWVERATAAGDFYNAPEPGPTKAAWALEQWRKARETR